MAASGLLVLSLCLPIWSEQPAPAATDLYGDALPTGALARLGSLRFKYEAHIISVVAFSPDRKVLAAVSGDIKNDGIRLWDFATGKEIRRFGGKRHGASCLLFSPDGKSLFTAGYDGGPNTRHAICHWDAGNAQELRQFAGYTSEVVALTLAPGGKTLVSAHADRSVRFWETQTGKETRNWPAPGLEHSPLALAPDGATVALMKDEKTIELWDAAAGVLVRGWPSNSGPAEILRFSPDGRMLASADTPGSTVRVWETATGQLRQELGAKLKRVSALVFSPDGNFLAAGDNDRILYLWDLADAKQLHKFQTTSWIYAAAFSADGKLLATGPGRGDLALHLWNLASGRRIEHGGGHRGEITEVAFTPDGKTVLSSSYDGTLRFWDPASGKELRQLSHPRGYGHFALTPDGRSLAVGTGDKTIRLHEDLGAGKETRQFQGTDLWFGHVGFSPDGRLLAARDTCGGLFLWDSATAKPHAPLPRLKNQPLSLRKGFAFAPDGKTVSVGGSKGVHCWDLATGKEQATLAGFAAGQVEELAFAPDGKTLALRYGASQVVVLDVAADKVVQKLAGVGSAVSALAISPDGKRVALGYGRPRGAGQECRVVLLDPIAGKEIASFVGHDAPVSALAFDPTGKRLVSGSWDSTVLVWDLKEDK